MVEWRFAKMQPEIEWDFSFSQEKIDMTVRQHHKLLAIIYALEKRLHFLKQKSCENRNFFSSGGEGGIRTRGRA